MIVLCMLNLYIYILNLFNNIDRTAYYEVIGYLLSQFEFYVFLLLREIRASRDLSGHSFSSCSEDRLLS